ncbi:MAG: hypothetical protein KF838_02665 [Phycisphaeraceae bacterium]|nr:MAG: hypothetical protein KF838_02665 [Phycisphaeraceae bacterium]
MGSRRSKRLIMLLAAVGLPLGLASCETNRGRTEKPSAVSGAIDPSIAPSLASLRSLARQQAGRRVPVDLAVPPGLDPTRVMPLDPVPPEATEPLSAVLPRLAGEVPVKPLEPLPTPPDADATRTALYLYARAQAALGMNKPANAIGFLDEAVKADPTRPELWRLRGDILSGTSQRFGAAAAYQRTLDLGLIEPRACLMLGLNAADRSDHLSAARYLAAAISHHVGGQDPALPIVAYASLGQSLHALGYLTAGNESLAFATGTPLQFTSTTNLRGELQSLTRRRSDIARDTGDAWVRLGNLENALESYARAASLPSIDESAITERRVYVLARSGRTAEAALVLLEDIAVSDLRIDDRHLVLLRSLAQSTTLGPLLSSAIGELPMLAAHTMRAQGAPEPRITPTISGRLARAALAIHPESAAPVLESHLRRYPLDHDVCADWISLLSDNPRKAATTLAALVSKQPLVSMTIGSTLSQTASGTSILGSLVSAPPAGLAAESDLLRAAMHHARGEWAQASVSLRALPSFPSEQFEGCAAVLAASCGDIALTERLLSRVSDASLRARAYLALQHAGDAQQAFVASLHDEAPPSQLELGAEIASLRRDAVTTESLLRRAIEADPFDERLYERLAALYRPGAPRADQDRLFAVYRELRESVPSSRLLRALNAQEAAQRNQFAQAERELVSLVQTSPDDTRSMQILLLVWEHMARTDPRALERGISVVESLRVERPDATAPILALARLLAAAGRTSEARDLLESKLQTRPTPDLASALESLIADALANPAVAYQLAVDRLSPLPRPIDATIELARRYASAGEIGLAAACLANDLPTSSTLTPGQGAALQIMVAELGPEITRSRGTARARDGIALLGIVASRTTSLAPGVHELRISTLASDPETDPASLIEAIEHARKDAPSLGQRPARLALSALLADDRNETALAVAVNELERVEAFDPELALATVRLSVITGDARDLGRVLETMRTAEDASMVLREIHPDGELALPPGASLDAVRAEIAFIAANAVTLSDETPDRSYDVYRLALAYNPTHAMAANNLGYTLLEEGRDLDEAASLLELAYRLAPDDANVVDSIGWLRYQQGIILDRQTPDGAVVEGAVTLLANALILDSDGGSPVSLDHYADALWAAGEREDAVEQWAHALATLERRMAALSAQGRSDPDHPKLLASLEAKLAAARAGSEPEIAPMRLLGTAGVPGSPALHSRDASR